MEKGIQPPKTIGVGDVPNKQNKTIEKPPKE